MNYDELAKETAEYFKNLAEYQKSDRSKYDSYDVFAQAIAFAIRRHEEMKQEKTET